MSEELRPCPFCGVNEWQYHAHFSGASVFQCEKCGAIVDECVLNTRPIEDALTARIAELEAERRWTPVGERLPELGQVVSVIDMNDKDSHLDNLHQVAVWVELKGVKMFGFVTNTSWVSSDVTHWMPLPKLPEVQE